LIVGLLVVVCVACDSAAPSPPQSGVAGLKLAARAYAQAVLNGRFTSLEHSLSPECKATDHVTAQNLPAAITIWEKSLGRSFGTIRITGVDVRDVTESGGQADVSYRPPAGNDNWVSYVLENGQWKVGGQCAVPIGTFRSSPGAD
jgi:hypothetical protein